MVQSAGLQVAKEHFFREQVIAGRDLRMDNPLGGSSGRALGKG